MKIITVVLGLIIVPISAFAEIPDYLLKKSTATVTVTASASVTLTPTMTFNYAKTSGSRMTATATVTVTAAQTNEEETPDKNLSMPAETLTTEKTPTPTSTVTATYVVTPVYGQTRMILYPNPCSGCNEVKIGFCNPPPEGKKVQIKLYTTGYRQIKEKWECIEGRDSVTLPGEWFEPLSNAAYYVVVIFKDKDYNVVGRTVDTMLVVKGKAN